MPSQKRSPRTPSGGRENAARHGARSDQASSAEPDRLGIVGSDALEALRAELADCRDQRDGALMELAKERAKLSAHFLSCPFALGAPPRQEATASMPLRYVLADSINDAIKTVLPRTLHRRVKAVLHKARAVSKAER